MEEEEEGSDSNGKEQKEVAEAWLSPGGWGGGNCSGSLSTRLPPLQPGFTRKAGISPPLPGLEVFTLLKLGAAAAGMPSET